MTSLEIPVLTLIGMVGAVAGAGGGIAVLRKSASENQADIKALEQEIKAHTKDDDKAFKEIMRSLGRIEGSLTELKRGK